MYLLALHIAEQHIRAHGLGHEIRGAQQLTHGLGRFRLRVEQILARGENADDIVRVLLVDREAGQAGRADRCEDLLARVLDPQHHHVGAVDHHVLGGRVVEFKDVVNELFLIRLDRAALLAEVHHHADLILAHVLLIGLGVDVQQAQYAVRGLGEQPDDRAEHRRHARHRTDREAGDRFGLFHGDALGHQLAEHKAEVREHDGDEHHHDRVERRGGNGREALVHRQPMHERIGKAVRREGRGQEAGECDGDLNGGKKAVRRLHEHKQLLRLLVALLRLLAQLRFRKRDDRDLRRGKECVDENQYDQYQNFRQ